MVVELPRWINVGVAPPEKLQVDGWKKGDRVPFQYLNWYMNRTYRALEELQLTKLSNAELNTFRGELLNEISNRVMVFNNVASMRDDMSVRVGAVVETLGFYSPNDGGGARYMIVRDGSTPDGYFDHAMSNGFFARLVIGPTNTVNIRQIGGRPQSISTKYDTKPYVDAYIRALSTSTEKASRLKLYVPAGVWAFSPTMISRDVGFSITGDYNFAHENLSMQGTIFTSLEDNQPYVICIGNGTRVLYNFELGNICISSADFAYRDGGYVTNGAKQITRAAIVFQGAAFGSVHPLMFVAVRGRAYELTSSWEIDFDRLTFRNILDYTKSVMVFTNVLPALSSYEPNITNVHYRVLDFEVVTGDLIEFENDCRFLNSDIATIVVEPTIAGADQIISLPNAAFNNETAVHFSVIRINGALTGSTIGNILLNNFSWRYGVKDGIQYVYDTIIGTYSDVKVIQLNVGSIALHGVNKGYDIIRNFVSSPASTGEFNIGEIRSNAQQDVYGKFNVLRFPPINVGVVRQNNLFAGKSNLPPSVKPASEFMNRSFTLGGPWKGMMSYDEAAMSPNKLALVPDAWLTENVADILQFVNPKREVKIRVKLPVGQVRSFYIHGNVNGVDNDDSFETVRVVGTGNYEWQTLLAANNKFDAFTPLFLNAMPNGISCYFDVLEFL